MCSLLVSSSRLSFSFSEEKKKGRKEPQRASRAKVMCSEEDENQSFYTQEYLDGTLWKKNIYLMGKLHLFLIRPVRRFKLTQLGDEAQLLFLLFFQVLLQDCTPLAHLRPKPIDTKVAAFFLPAFPIKTDICVGVCAPWASPFLQEVDGVLQRLVLLLQLLVAVVKHLKSLSISFFYYFFFRRNQISG